MASIRLKRLNRNACVATPRRGSFPGGPIAPFTGGQAPGQWRLNPGTASWSRFSGQFNRLMRELAAAHVGGTDLASLGDRARLFALANTAAADAVICAWNSKISFSLWRPIQAIRNGGADGNILTDEDSTWTPYMATPNYSDYTSGANNFSGSMTRALELFFGSDKPFDAPFRMYWLGGAVPLEPGDLPYREFSRFSDIAKEIIDALTLPFRGKGVVGQDWITNGGHGCVWNAFAPITASVASSSVQIRTPTSSETG